MDTIDKDSSKEYHTQLLIKAVIEGLFFSGFRLGEFLGLRFKDIDFDILNKKNIDKEEIKIEIKTPITYDGGWIETKGKTFDSIRTKYLGKNSFTPIFEYVKYWQAYGVRYNKDDYIFTSPISGKIISPTQLRQHVNYYMDKAGLKRLKLKDFRHSYATLLMSNGYRLEDIKEELGHTSIKITEKHYSTLYDENKKNIAKNIDKLI
jgi:integrase